jgi:hypothetical protein
VIWRIRHYTVAPHQVAMFNNFFRDHRLPVQQRHDAKLVGRWQSEDGTQIVAIWVYESKEHYHAIQARVAADTQSAEAQRIRRQMLEPLFLEMEEWFGESTVPLEHTELAHLVE